LPQQQTKNKVQTAPVERSNLSITITANGTVQPERSVNVSPKTAGILKELLVKEGDVVEQGQILAYMDDSNLQGQLRQAQGNLAAAEANGEKISAGNRQEDTAQAKAKLQDMKFVLRQAEADLGRNRSLSQAGAISRQAFDVALTARDRAQAQVRQAQEALDLSNAGARPEDIAEAEAQVASAQGAMQTIQANLNDMVLRAPFSGTVSRKFADPGAFVTPTTAGSAVSSATSSSILALASTNQIMTQVAEANIAQTRIGLPIWMPLVFLGSKVRDTLFNPNESAIGADLRIQGKRYTVVGVAKSKGSVGGQDLDDVVYIPLSNMSAQIVANILRLRHRIRPPQLDDFRIVNQVDIIKTFTSVMGSLTLLVGAIAGISLVVGGIGIANIMLVSVMERTREIGIRKAVGATSSSILSQFLTEAIVISIVGGAIGVGLGIGVAFTAATVFNFPFIVPLWSIVTGFGLSLLVGVLAGGIPARNAAKLDPITALHNQ
jgi:multidrug efflux pump subunit AcrA (membrane-fusion protein)